MPNVTVVLSNEMVARLNVRVAEYNLANGTSIGLTAWIALHLRETAIERELMTSIEGFKQQAERDVAAAAIAERDRLLSL
jgi:hypothetical protein